MSEQQIQSAAAVSYKRAANILYVCIVLSFIHTVIMLFRAPPDITKDEIKWVVISVVVALAFSAGIANQVGKGKRWAFWLLMAGTLLSIIEPARYVRDINEGHIFDGSFSLIRFGVGMYAIYILFRAKFKKYFDPQPNP